MEASKEDLEKKRERILEETRALFESNENTWRAIAAEIISRSEGLQQLIDNREQLMTLCRQERAIYIELLKLENPA